MVSNTNKNPTNSSHIPQAGATLPGPPQPARDRERDGAQHGPVLPPNPPLPRTGPTRGRAKGPAKHAGPTAGPMTTGMISSNRPGCYHQRDWRWWWASRRAIAAKETKKPRKERTTRKKKRKIDFSDLRSPTKNFAPLFGELAKFRTLTEKEEQQSRDSHRVEHSLPQNT